MPLTLNLFETNQVQNAYSVNFILMIDMNLQSVQELSVEQDCQL